MTQFHSADATVAAYESGFKGFIPDVKADDEFAAYIRDHGGYSRAGDAIDDYGLRDSGKGKLSLPHIAALQLFPGSLPGGRQMRGSCVAWSTRNAAAVSYAGHLIYGSNPERFAPPVVSPVGIQNGVYCTENIYWFRRKSSDGWQCSSAAQVVIAESGLMLRQNYPELGLDLTEYNPTTEGKWGLTLPPANVRDACQKHLVGSATVCEGWESVRDMLANSYAISSCGMESFSRERDAYGVCQRTREGWAHAMAVIGADDRPEIVERYGCGLALIQNSWGDYLKGPDAIMGTGLRIPVGSFWAKWVDIKDRYFVALGPAKGWPAQKLPDWGLKGIL